MNLERAKAINGWMTEKELECLALHASKAQSIIEIGCFQGRSTRAMADNSSAVIYAVDPWNVENYNELGVAFVSTEITLSFFYCNLKKYIKSDRVIPCRVRWEHYEPKEKVDFIFIDGDHRYSSVKHDITKALKFLKPGGTLAGHDYDLEWPGVHKAVNEFFPNFNVVDTIWWLNV